MSHIFIINQNSNFIVSHRFDVRITSHEFKRKNTFKKKLDTQQGFDFSLIVNTFRLNGMNQFDSEWNIVLP